MMWSRHYVVFRWVLTKRGPPFWTRKSFFWRKKNIIKFGAYFENCSSQLFQRIAENFLYPQLFKYADVILSCNLSYQVLQHGEEYDILYITPARKE